MKLFTLKLGKYNKFISAIVGLVAIVGVATFDGDLTDSEAAVILSAAITAGGVLGVRNKYSEEVQRILDEYAASKADEGRNS